MTKYQKFYMWVGFIVTWALVIAIITIVVAMQLFVNANT